MNTDKIIKWTNRIALLSITLLIYWVFVFISITVFDFKVFRENITEIYYLSILGILALMLGAIVVNIMFNLTKISSIINQNSTIIPAQKKQGKMFLIFLISFPIIFVLLYFGDMQSSFKKERMIKESARALTKENQPILTQLSNYQFENSWRSLARNNLLLLEKIDESFPDIKLIVADEINEKPVFLAFNDYYYKKNDKKVDFIYSCSASERAYLTDVFEGNLKELFSSSDGHYELYYPVEISGKIIVLYLSERQRYGKLGS